MSRRSRTGRRLLTAAAAAVLATSMGLGSTSQAAPPGPGPAQPVPTATPGSVSLPTAKLAGGLDARRAGSVAVFVQLSGQGAAAAAETARAHGKNKASQQAAARSAKTDAAGRSAAVVKQAKQADGGAREMWQIGNALPGVAIIADMAAIRSIASRGDVVKITPLVPKHPLNSNASELTNVVATWQQTHNTGQGVTVAVIDTGIDFTHADFGGPGTEAAWNDAHTNNADPNWRAGLTALATAKIAGGYDFVGDRYNADPQASDYQPVPHPDADPIDCNGHGSHVAGIAAGYGENADGSTFTGDYPGLTSGSLADMKIDPGMAPEATLYSLKVFGCTGSTDVVIPALDRTLDLEGDGSMVQADVVNLSLGSDYGTVDDPENDVVNAIAQAGVVPVIAMGNNGDLTDTGGSPGNAVRSLAVASSVDSYQQMDGLRVDAPTAVAGVIAGQMSVAYDWAHNGPTGGPVTGEVVSLSAANADGCDSLSDADAAAVKGKVAWLTWDSNDSTRRCGSAGRSANVKAAGAIGAVFTGDVNPFAAGITGDADIPVFQLTRAATEKLAGAVNNGLTVTFDGALALTIGDVDPSINDLISSFSSRGTHGSIGVVKPDVAAPGDTIISAGMGLGTGAANLSGTSMATPHTAGIAALVKAVHPTWSVEQIKADIMNTAAHDVWTEPGQTGLPYGPARDGAGRVDALAAVNNTLLAFADAGSGGVSVSFGPVEAPATQATVTQTRTVTLQNTGSSAVSASLSYDAVDVQPGVAYSVSPAGVTVAAGASTTVTVTMTITTAALRNTIDPTMVADQIGVPRQFVADASGRLLVSVAGSANPLRVPVYGAAKPVSVTRTADRHVGSGRTLALSGTGNPSAAWPSLLSVMDLGATSGRLPACSATATQNCTVNQTAVAGDLQYVGAGATKATNSKTGKLSYTDGWLYFGISTYGDWATIGNSTIPYVDFDTTGDHKPDYEVYVQNYPSTDVLLAILVDLHTGEVVDLEPVNFAFADVNTNVFDTNVLTIPVWPRAIGVTDSTKSFPITYTVGTFSYYATNPNGDIDDVGPVRFDAVNPTVQVDGPLYLDRGNTEIPYVRGDLAGKGVGNAKGHSARALILHLHGASGQRAEVVTLGG